MTHPTPPPLWPPQAGETWQTPVSSTNPHQ